ncbi:uncharacterized protein LOC116110899 [Pistacia vera]|uniref:Uncharacterized protein n=2 Tax=Pistacia TaxID=55512 RepID=A0ACC1AZR1_9ROSI|nr:uncharacterized protein LOC116110899 [Pistacia vera]KAJ0034426.1 hypothetical protein Pint_24300 [Pistacia integerrima]KAJ0092137.1 hypothetical protein Patl1_24837 [Pistacia atlantica]
MCARWSASYFRWPDFEFSFSPSFFRWPEFDFSYFTSGWNLHQSFRWFDFSIDDLLWTFVTVFESFLLVSMLCYFFLFCGCTL